MSLGLSLATRTIVILIKRLEGTILAGVPLERTSVNSAEINIIREWIRGGAALD